MSGEGVALWHCPDCAFGFDACHTNQDGGYSCPACGELRAETDLAAANERVAGLTEERDEAQRYGLIWKKRAEDAEEAVERVEALIVYYESGTATETGVSIPSVIPEGVGRRLRAALQGPGEGETGQERGATGAQAAQEGEGAPPSVREAAGLSGAQKPYPVDLYPGCPCLRCDMERRDADPGSWLHLMNLCPECGDKRCPGANNHADHRDDDRGR